MQTAPRDDSRALADLGIWGLGVMGRNLACNLEDKGFRAARYDPWPAARAAVSEAAVAATAPAFVAALKRPRAILVMVKAGEPVDEALSTLIPLLAPGDLVIDGGNSHFRDSERRGKTLAARGLDFIGLGVSGGEEGARHGPSLMAGGAAAAYARIAPLLEAIAARVEGEPCCAHLGAAGAGHFVKMVHNGIEYADMQLIAEAYLLLRDLCGLPPHAIAAEIACWSAGEAGGYLLEITERILRRADEDGTPLLDHVEDAAEQKGTGQWAAVAALELGVPVPTLIEAVAARSLSARKAERVAAAVPPLGAPPGDPASVRDSLGDALLAGKICAYVQGFTLLAEAKTAYGWELDLARVARIWRGGCIIRSRLLDRIAAACSGTPANLLAAPELAQLLDRAAAGWRRVVAAAAANRIAVPAMASALAYFDGYRTARSGANLIQAQRDAFGAHGYARTDRAGTFHTDWLK